MFNINIIRFHYAKRTGIQSAANPATGRLENLGD